MKMKRQIVRPRREQQMYLVSLLSDLTGVSTLEIFPLVVGPVALGLMSLDLDAKVRRVGEQALYAEHPWRVFIREYRKFLTLELVDERGPTCDLCGGSGTDLHEAFVTRAQVTGWRQFYIFCPENCVFLCPKCHRMPSTRDRLWRLQVARGYDLDSQGRWPKIREVLRSDG